MEGLKNLFSTRWGIVGVGVLIGILASLLQKLGNPGNMGICVACFERDIAGGLGLHRAAVVQYLRPEIFGFVLGSLGAAYLFREFRPRMGSAPVVRFVLGVFAMIGALVFLGCPWRAALRLAGGDGSAVFGLLGLIGGIWLGTLFLRGGYSLGRNNASYTAAGWMFPLIIVGLLTLRVLFLPWKDRRKAGFSLQPKGSRGDARVPGCFPGDRPGRRFCRPEKPILHHGRHSGFHSVPANPSSIRLCRPHCGGLCNESRFQAVSSRFCRPAGGPHHATLEFSGMALAGLAFALAGGCPGRQLFLAGEGDGDAAVFVLGMITGAAVAHNFGLASSPAGVGPHGVASVIVGFAACLFIGFTMRRKIS